MTTLEQIQGRPIFKKIQPNFDPRTESKRHREIPIRKWETDDTRQPYKKKQQKTTSNTKAQGQRWQNYSKKKGWPREMKNKWKRPYQIKLRKEKTESVKINLQWWHFLFTSVCCGLLVLKRSAWYVFYKSRALVNQRTDFGGFTPNRKRKEQNKKHEKQITSRNCTCLRTYHKGDLLLAKIRNMVKSPPENVFDNLFALDYTSSHYDYLELFGHCFLYDQTNFKEMNGLDRNGSRDSKSTSTRIVNMLWFKPDTMNMLWFN